MFKYQNAILLFLNDTGVGGNLLFSPRSDRALFLINIIMYPTFSFKEIKYKHEENLCIRKTVFHNVPETAIRNMVANQNSEKENHFGGRTNI